MAPIEGQTYSGGAVIEQQEPVHEQTLMLEKRLEQALEHVESGRTLVRLWEPVVHSCRAGLEALQQPQLQQPDRF